MSKTALRKMLLLKSVVYFALRRMTPKVWNVPSFESVWKKMANPGKFKLLKVF